MNTEELESRKFLTLEPPLGEFVCMNYRVTSKDALGAMPFRVYPVLVETSDPCRVELTLNVRCEGLPSRLYAADVEVRFPVPPTSLAVWPSVARDSLTEAFHQAARGQGGPAAAKIPTQRAKMDHTVEYLSGKKEVVWCIKKFPGGTDATLKVRISLSTPPPSSTFRKTLGPIAMTFEVPDHNLTRLRVRGGHSCVLFPPPHAPPPQKNLHSLWHTHTHTHFQPTLTHLYRSRTAKYRMAGQCGAGT